MKTQRFTGSKGCELSVDIPTTTAGGTEAIFLSPDNKGVVFAIKPTAGVEVIETGVTGTFHYSPGVDEVVGEYAVATLTVTSAPTTPGDWEIALFGASPVVVTMLGTETINETASTIRSATFTGWTLSGSNEVVVFTQNTKATTTGNGTLQLGSGASGSGTWGDPVQGVTAVTGEPQIVTLTVDTGATTNLGDISVKLYGGAEWITSVAKNDSANQVATKLRATPAAGWTVSGSNADVIYTHNTNGLLTGTTVLADKTGELKATSVKTQYSIDSLSRIKAGTAEWVDLDTKASGSGYFERVITYPVSALRLDVLTPAAQSVCRFIVRTSE